MGDAADDAARRAEQEAEEQGTAYSEAMYHRDRAHRDREQQQEGRLHTMVFSDADLRALRDKLDGTDDDRLGRICRRLDVAVRS